MRRPTVAPSIRPLVMSGTLNSGGFSQRADLEISAAPLGETPDIIDLNRLGANENEGSRMAGWTVAY